jgi:hypothetical protein
LEIHSQNAIESRRNPWLFFCAWIFPEIRLYVIPDMILCICFPILNFEPAPSIALHFRVHPPPKSNHSREDVLMARISLVLVVLISFTVSVSFAQGSGCATATNVIPGTSPTGVITNAVTVHYWKITIPLNGYLRVQINSDAVINVDVALFDALPDTSNALSNDNQIGPTSEVWGLLKAGTYFIKIWRVNGVGNYTMNTFFTAAPRPSDPEPNNTPAFASPLSPNGTSTGNIGYFGNRTGDNEDYWKIKVTEDGYLRVWIQADSIDLRGGPPYFEVQVDMYDTNGTSRIAYDIRPGTFSEVWQFVRAGTYYINVWLFAGRAASYQITSEFFPPARANDVDGNDSPQTATQAIVNGTVTGHVYYLCGGFYDGWDYWKFTLPSDGKVTIQVTSDSLDAVGSIVDLNLTIQELNGTRIDQTAYDVRYTSYAEITVYLMGGRTFYPRVERIAGHGASYSMTILFTPCDKAGELEPNDWFGAADQLTLNTLISGHMGFYAYARNDYYDFWKITAPATDSLYVHVTSDPSLEVNLAAWGPDTAINSYIALDNRAGIYSRVGVKATAGLTYYFRVDRIFTLPSWYTIIATRSSSAVSVEENTQAKVIPTILALEQNYPNPFNPGTTIRYDLPESQNVKITVYSLLGQEIAELVNAVQSPGSYRVQWNGKDRLGHDMPSGIYPVRMLAGNSQLVKKAMLVR